MNLALTFPFFEKFLQELLHNFMPLLSQFLAGFGKHAVFQEEKFFVEVIDGGAFAVLILFKTDVHLWGRVRIVERTVFVAAVGEGDAPEDRGVELGD